MAIKNVTNGILKYVRSLKIATRKISKHGRLYKIKKGDSTMDIRHSAIPGNENISILISERYGDEDFHTGIDISFEELRAIYMSIFQDSKDIAEL